MNENKKSTSTKTIVTIVSLILLFPLGVLLMWFITRWPKPVKLVVTAIVALILFGDAYAFNHASSHAENQLVITKAPLTATLIPTKRPTPTTSISPTPTRRAVYVSPTVIPTSSTATSISTTPIVNSQQADQTNNGATALCIDGTYSYAAHDQGACSHHQGVKQFYK